MSFSALKSWTPMACFGLLLWHTKFHTNMTKDKIVNLCMTFWYWSVSQYSVQYVTKWTCCVNMLLEACLFWYANCSSLCLCWVIGASGAEKGSCMWALCASEVLWEARCYNVQETLQQVAGLWPQVHHFLFCCVHTEVSGVGSLRSTTRVWTPDLRILLHAEPKWVTSLYVQAVLCLDLSSFHIHWSQIF
jgi:hypothetical protein